MKLIFCLLIYVQYIEYQDPTTTVRPRRIYEQIYRIREIKGTDWNSIHGLEENWPMVPGENYNLATPDQCGVADEVFRAIGKKVKTIWSRLTRPTHDDDVIMGAIASQITSLTIVYSTVYSDADQRKHQSAASLAFVRGIHRGKCFHLMTSSWSVL